MSKNDFYSGLNDFIALSGLMDTQNEALARAVFGFFADISSIPRGSGNEAGIAEFIESFAAARKNSHGLVCLRDGQNNVFIRKPASKGYENRPAVMLQGHLDMVCEQNAEKTQKPHDFTFEPLDLRFENITDTNKNGESTISASTIIALSTTLGADDGAAVAIMLAVLDDKAAPHPELECLFTTGEEVGLTGAKAFDCANTPDFGKSASASDSIPTVPVKAERIINLDSETEGEAVCGCAGGVRFDMHRELSLISVPKTHKLMTVSASGFAGGHSGADIDLGRQNALRTLSRVLAAMYDARPFMLLSFNGGSADNAIPRDAAAVLCTDMPELHEAKARGIFDEIRKEITLNEDSHAKFRVSVKSTVPEKAISFKDTSAVLSALLLPKIGPFSKIRGMTGETFVETSANLGIAEIASEANSAKITYSLRSNTESKLDALITDFRWYAQSFGFDSSLRGRYPGWRFSGSSSLADLYHTLYRELFFDKPEPKLSVIHAGLECGILYEKLAAQRAQRTQNSVNEKPAPDIISIGPDIKNIHTPDESMDAFSFLRTYFLVRAMLENC